MFSLTAYNIRFIPRWRMSLFALAVVLLFTRLGFWQLHRAHEKQEMLAVHQTFAKQIPKNWQPGYPEPGQYQQISIQGHFLAKILFLDNQHYQHQFGYHVISPLLLANDQVILVDRGWVAGDIGRKTMPMTETPTGLVHLAGTVYFPSEKNWVLGQALEKIEKNIAIVELVDNHLISQFLHKSVYPFMIRLNKNQASLTDGFVQEWPVVAMSPQRHYGYALQWFAMALVILILFIVLNFKRNYENG